MRTLVSRLEALRAEVVAIAGFAKNCGKTTTLTHMRAGYEQLGRQLGLTSVGRDGEAVDVVTRQPKPRIKVSPGTLLATASQSLATSSAPSREIRRTGIASALGEIVLAEVLESGLAELSGPTTVSQAREVVRMLREVGAERVLIDGALDRRASCSPAVCDAVVLAGGAVLGATVESACARIAYGVRLFELPEVDGLIAGLLRSALPESGFQAAAVVEEGRVVMLPGSALTQLHQIQAATSGLPSHFYVGGALTDEIVRKLARLERLPEIVVADATRVLLSPMALAQWEVAGGRVRVLDTIRVCAVTTNPFNPTGPSLPAAALLDAVAEAVPGLPIYDVVAGLSAVGAHVLCQRP
jgi:hypothetical protein